MSETDNFQVLEPITEPTEDGLKALYVQDGAFDFFMDRLRSYLEPARAADITTKEGQALVRSSAAIVAKIKVRVEKRGKELTEDLRNETKRINGVRDAMVEVLATEQGDVRKALTALEEAEKEREALVSRLFERIAAAGTIRAEDTAALVAKRITGMEGFAIDPEVFKDRTEEAAVKLAEALKELRAAHPRLEKAEADAARVRELEARERQRVAEEIERNQALAAQQAAEARRAELARIEAETAERVARETEERVRREEQQRHAQEEARAAAEKAEEERRQRDADHRAAVHAEIRKSLSAIIGEGLAADTILSALTAGEIPHVSIRY